MMTSQQITTKTISIMDIKTFIGDKVEYDTASATISTVKGDLILCVEDDGIKALFAEPNFKYSNQARSLLHQLGQFIADAINEKLKREK